jgi:CRISPR-associated protein (TIGR03986 family)
MSLTAPYNFVPLSDRVCTASDLGLPKGLPSQDDPATGGLCGELQIILTAQAPILVAGVQDGREKRFFETPKGRAIPGSSMRGMIRNVIEIASFGRMWRVEDRRYGMRDLNKTARLDYGSRMSFDHEDETYEANARGGWLTETSEGLLLEEVAYGRVEHDDLGSSFARKAKALGANPNVEKKTAMALEGFYSGADEQPFQIEELRETHAHRAGKKLIYRKAYLSKTDALDDKKVERKGSLTAVKARIVFTGMPGGKHMEFAFPLATKSGKIAVSAEVWGKFIDVHENLEKKSPTWLDRRTKLRNGDSIPVFFLLKRGETELTADNLDQIGLSMMFKMAGENSTHQMMPVAHTKDEDLIDLATRMFGRISKENGSFRGRISFGIMQEQGRASLRYQDGEWLILSSPKPSYFPSYVRQRDLQSPGQLHKQAQYRSYMNWKRVGGLDGGQDQIRGWKRYPISVGEVTLAPQQRNNSASHLFPLSKGAIFTGRIRFHNLHKIELGALLWALQWDGEDDCYHSVGMGKPFGWGQATVKVDKPRFNTPVEGETDYIGVFTGAMNKVVKGWRNSDQIKSLLEMARAVHGPEVIRQMVLGEFRDAKGQSQTLPDIGFESGDITDKPNLTTMKRWPTPEEVAQKAQREEQEAAGDMVWVSLGNLVRTRMEIDGKVYLVKGQALENQKGEDDLIKINFGGDIGVLYYSRADLEILP